MSANLDRNYDHGSQSDDNYQFERYRIEPIYDALVCHLTKQIMQDPVTIENGETFEREAIEKWFKNCKDSGKRLVCPRTEKELKSADMNPSIALRKMIEEWSARNEAALVDIAQRSFTLENAESEIIRGLSFVQYICQNSLQNKHIVRKVGLLPRIMDMLRSSSCPIRCKALETLRISAEEDVDIKEIMAEGNIVRTIVKFLSHEPSKDREEAISLLYELSKSELLSEKIGSINGAIIILMAISSSRAENDFTVETAEKTLLNLESSENNVRQMAEYGRLQPLLSQLLDGTFQFHLFMIPSNNTFSITDSKLILN
ncbi:hypothetical protein SAY86_004876 [Trapa natans]|uniref:RING-type E3 ubiquitin transferase n=1 Tax=Trapa natans TaxID=22666 RepID=A0AAN7MGB1_TRANT|nr:hypothetical protein SAY86_004876 [Trapa natans]